MAFRVKKRYPFNQEWYAMRDAEIKHILYEAHYCVVSAKDETGEFLIVCTPRDIAGRKVYHHTNPQYRKDLNNA